MCASIKRPTGGHYRNREPSNGGAIGARRSENAQKSLIYQWISLLTNGVHK
jgi:hypothetical protein